jgi:hypothetical protein
MCSSNPDVVAKFVNTLWPDEAIDYLQAPGRKLVHNYFQFAVHNKQLSYHVAALKFI